MQTWHGRGGTKFAKHRGVFRLQKRPQSRGAPLPAVPRSAPGAPGSSSPRGGRKPAAGCGRPLSAAEARRLPNFGRAARSSRSPSSRSPPAGLPLCWSGALEAEEEGWGAGSLRGAPLGTGSRPGTPGRGLPRRRRRRPSRSSSPAAAAPAPRRLPRPAATSPATLFREISPSRLPVRPWPRPGPSGHRRLGSGERGAQSHLTACPVVERPPNAPSRPVAAGPALSWPGAARPRGSRSGASLPQAQAPGLRLSENGSHAPSSATLGSSGDIFSFRDKFPLAPPLSPSQLAGVPDLWALLPRVY